MLKISEKLFINGNDLSYKKFMYDNVCIIGGGGTAPTYQDIVLSGVGSLTLANAKADSLEYLKLFGGTELLPETYIDSVTAEGKCEQRNLPEGYTELNYIETDGNEYIDINVSGNVTFLGTAQSTTDEPATSQVLFANGGAQAGRWFGVQSPGAGTGFAKKWGLGATATASTSIDGTTKVDFEITFSDVDGQYGTVNNETLTRTTSIPTQTDWIILAGNDIGQYGFIGKIWKLQAVQNNVLVRDLIPCKNSSNVVGMYDTVNGVFYQNAGTGTFTAGPVAVPTPDTPIDIVCNNGAIKYSKNMCDVKASNVVVGKYISAQGVLSDSDNNFTYIQYIPVKPNTTYTLSFSSPVYFASISEYNTAEDSGFIKRNTYYSVNTGNPPYDLVQCTVTTSSTTNYIRLGSNMYKSTAITIDDVLAVNYMFEIGSTPTAYVPYVEGGIYTDGTTETVTDSNGLTATCEMLLSAGNYKDTQEILSGAVTRNIGIKVLDGTEDIGRSSAYAGSYFIRNVVSGWGTSNNAPVYCSHFGGVTESSNYVQDKCMILNNAFNMWWYSDSTPTAAQFSAWLAQQYAQGTPVIVIYTLATATTESVTSQVLTKAPVTYAGSISGLTGTVVTSSHTTPTPTQPLQLNCNNGVVKVSPYGQIYVDGTTEKVEVFGKNLFDKSDVITGKILNDTGAVVNQSSGYYSGHISVNASTGYTISQTGGEEIYLRILEYDSTDTMVKLNKGNQSGTQTKIFTTGATTTYVIVSGSTKRDALNTLQLELGSTATTYEPYFNGGTATAQDLYKVGTYQDVQSVLDGAVTRKVGVKVLNGSEDWTYRNSRFRLTISDYLIGSSIMAIIISHYKLPEINVGSIANGEARFGKPSFTDTVSSDNILIVHDDNYTDVNSYKSWLASQYNSGNPVVIVYPLATATSETVTGQSLTTKSGSNTITITQASISNLPLEVSYKGIATE